MPEKRLPILSYPFLHLLNLAYLDTFRRDLYPYLVIHPDEIYDGLPSITHSIHSMAVKMFFYSYLGLTSKTYYESVHVNCLIIGRFLAKHADTDEIQYDYQEMGKKIAQQYLYKTKNNPSKRRALVQDLEQLEKKFKAFSI